MWSRGGKTKINIGMQLAISRAGIQSDNTHCNYTNAEDQRFICKRKVTTTSVGYPTP